MPQSDLPQGGLPRWAESIAGRLEFFAQRGLVDRIAASECTTALRAAIGTSGSAKVLDRFLRACLDMVEQQATTRADLAEARDGLISLCGLARTALDGDLDDRPLLAPSYALMEIAGAPGRAAPVPGRVVWLAAMVASVPEEEGAAAVMLINDLAAVNVELALKALASRV